MGSHMREFGLRSPYDKVGGLLYFGRMLDKIRSHAKGELPLECEVNLGKGFDEKCLTFLRVRYEAVIECVNLGLTEGATLDSCFGLAPRPREDAVYMWMEYIRERDCSSEF